MWTIKFKLTLTLIVFGYSQPSSTEITVSELLGHWYVNAMIAPYDISNLTCIYRTIEQGDEVNTFHVSDIYYVNGLFRSLVGVGKIENSTELITYKNKESISGVITSYRNGESLIIHYKLKSGNLYTLFSRQPIADSETLQKLTTIAMDVASPIITIKQDQCIRRG